MLRNTTLQCLLVIILAAAPHAAYAKKADVATLKAAFTAKFIAYAKWPETNSPSSRINVCILGRSDTNKIDDVLSAANKKAKGKRVYKLIHKTNWAGVGVDCHILYIGEGQKANLAQLVEDLKDQPVLTVSDVEGFARMGGMIEFTIANNKIRLNVNTKTAKRAGVSIKSSLLELALNVIR